MPTTSKPAHLDGAYAPQQGSHCNEKPVHHNEGEAPLTTTRESVHSSKDPVNPKRKKKETKHSLSKQTKQADSSVPLESAPNSVFTVTLAKTGYSTRDTANSQIQEGLMQVYF